MNSIDVKREEERKAMEDLNQDTGVYCFIPISWVKSWAKFIKGDGQRPGDVCVGEFFEDDKLKSGLKVMKDYRMLYEKQWEFIKSNYNVDREIMGSKKDIYESFKQMQAGEDIRNTSRDNRVRSSSGVESKPRFVEKPLIHANKPVENFKDKRSIKKNSDEENFIKSSEFVVKTANPNRRAPEQKTSDHIKSSDQPKLYDIPKPLIQPKSKDQSKPPIPSKTPPRISIRPSTSTPLRQKNEIDPPKAIISFASPSPSTNSSETSILTRLSLISQAILPAKPLVFGIKNPRFQCFLNTTIQCLFSFPSFTEELSSLPSSGPVCKSLKHILSQAQSSSSPISCQPLASIFTRHFPSYKQHDAPEFCRLLLDTLDSELAKPPSRRSSDPWQSSVNTHSSLISNTFLGLLCSTVQCQRCLTQTFSYEPFKMLPLKVTSSLSSSLSEFMSKEKIKKEYNCEKCKSKQDIVKSYSIERLPRCLLIQLKRFKSGSVKIGSKCEFEVGICVKDGKDRVGKYELVAVAVHLGSTDGGHYFAYGVRQGWYCFNDEMVSQVRVGEVLGAQAYMLCYSLIG